MARVYIRIYMLYGKMSCKGFPPPSKSLSLFKPKSILNFDYVLGRYKFLVSVYFI